jgi:hypothetical protein
MGETLGKFVSKETTRECLNICIILHFEESRLRVFENRVLRRVFGPNRDEVTGEWRKLHNEELNDLYCPANIVRVIKPRRM